MFSVSSVSKSYGKNKVLTDVSLSVSPGECIALLGINGSGKSTLLGILSRNIKPDSGQTCLKALRWNEEEAKPCHHDDV